MNQNSALPSGTSPHRWLWGIALGLALLVATATVLLFVGALLDPAQSPYAMVSSSLWSTIGPHLAVGSLLVLLAGVGGRRALPQLAAATRLLGLLALLSALYVTVRIVSATVAAGGTANPFTALAISSMTTNPADQPDSIVTVAQAGGQPLRAAIYCPAHLAGAAPVLVYIHGGGWVTGSYQETAADLRWFAERGWLVISLDYRLAKPGQPTWDQAPLDVACGLAWVQANAALFGGNVARLSLLGDSAGGNLAINLAYATAQGQQAAGCEGRVPVPEAVVVQYPVVDPQAFYDEGFPAPGFEPRQLTTAYIGGSPQAHPDRMRAISSATYLSAQAPPTLVLEPEKDGLVVSSSVFRFVEQARAAGVPVELVRIPFANHVYNQGAANSLGNQARRSITVRYLTQRGLAPAGR